MWNLANDVREDEGSVVVPLGFAPDLVLAREAAEALRDRLGAILQDMGVRGSESPTVERRPETTAADVIAKAIEMTTRERERHYVDNTVSALTVLISRFRKIADEVGQPVAPF